AGERADALHPGVLSRLGRRLRRGSVARLRAGSDRHGGEAVPGAAGANRATARPGPPPRVAGAGRTLLRPRSHRPEGHPRRDHPDHRPRGPDGALLLPPAGRGGGSGPARHHDRPRPHRAERAAGRAQGLASSQWTRPLARGDLHRSRGHLVTVRSPALAIGWELLRRHRWGFAAAAGYVLFLWTARALGPGLGVLTGRDPELSFAFTFTVPTSIFFF